MDFQVAFSKSALEELKEIHASISYENPRAGDNFYGRLRQNALSLRRFPNRHRAVPHRLNIRKFSVGNYTIYYRVNELKRRVTVLHFWHGARQPPFL
jgi:plasmid stabilization system protein ParE